MSLVLILDNIRSSENVGSIFRTADAFLVSKIFLCGITPAPLDRFGRPNPKIAKAALGAEQNIKWQAVSKTDETIQNLKKDGYKILAIEQAENSKSLSEIKSSGNVALLFGNEVKGLTQEVLDICDESYELPMKGSKESLNVAVMAGIALFALLSYR